MDKVCGENSQCVQYPNGSISCICLPGYHQLSINSSGSGDSDSSGDSSCIGELL